jgi:hypothetical protein
MGVPTTYKPAFMAGSVGGAWPNRTGIFPVARLRSSLQRWLVPTGQKKRLICWRIRVEKIYEKNI